MKSTKTIFLIPFIIFLLSSCAPQKTIVDTSCSGYKSQEFSQEDISSKGIGIMPVLGGGEKEQYRRPMADAINKHFKEKFGANNVKTTDQVRDILNEKGISKEYSDALRNYRESGMVPAEMVGELKKALSVDYLLYTRLLSSTEYGEISTGYYTSKEFSVDEIYLQTQVWDTKGDVVWEGKGGIAKLPKNEADITNEAAKGLANVVGTDKDFGPCEETKELIDAKKDANTNSWLLVGLLTIPVFLFL